MATKKIQNPYIRLLGFNYWKDEHAACADFGIPSNSYPDLTCNMVSFCTLLIFVDASVSGQALGS
eukprot:scaffold85056_cov17-Tisochrysis_lutea.AAC.1